MAVLPLSLRSSDRLNQPTQILDSVTVSDDRLRSWSDSDLRLGGSAPVGQRLRYSDLQFSRDSRLWPHLASEIMEKLVDRVLVPNLRAAVEAEGLDTVCANVKQAWASTVGYGSSIYEAKRHGDRQEPRAGFKFLDPSTGGITPSEFARTYGRKTIELARVRYETGAFKSGVFGLIPKSAPKGAKQANAQLTAQLLSAPAPLYLNKPSLQPLTGRFAYVDLTAAYWSIMRKATLDLEYNPRLDICVPGLIEWPDVDEVTAARALRHSIPGMIRSRSTPSLEFGQLAETSEKGTGFGLFAPKLTGFIMHSMQAIAQEVVAKFNCHMILTDAFIVDEAQGPAVVDYLASEWGLGSKIKHQGSGVIYGLGYYQIGDREAPEQLVNEVSTSNFVDVPDFSWLKEQHLLLVAERAARGSDQVSLLESHQGAGLLNFIPLSVVEAQLCENSKCRRELGPERLARHAVFCDEECRRVAGLVGPANTRRASKILSGSPLSQPVKVSEAQAPVRVDNFAGLF